MKLRGAIWSGNQITQNCSGANPKEDNFPFRFAALKQALQKSWC